MTREKKKVSNPVTLVPKPVLDAFPIRHVTDLLQRDERQDEQPSKRASALSRAIGDDHQDEEAHNQSSMKGDDIVYATPPSPLDDGSSGSCSSREGHADALSCPRCSKRFLSGSSLRKHLAKLYPCDQPRSVIVSREGKVESKTCFKCGNTFASWQGLKKHLNRVKPCDQENIVSPVINRHPPASRTCAKCGKTFSSPQSLRIHMNRVKPCDQDPKNVLDPTTPPGTTTSPTTLTLIDADGLKKEAERKAKARYQARKAYLKKRGRLGELGDPPSANYQSGDDVNRTKKTNPDSSLKRSASNEMFYENVGSTRRVVKRPRVEEEPAHEDESASSPSDVSGLTQPCTSTSSHTTSKEALTTEGSFVHRPHKGHGGDLLAGGCSCPPCVRRWATKLMNRMQQLEDEVLMLRQKESIGADAARTASTKPHVDPGTTQRPPESLLSIAASTADNGVGVSSNSQVESEDIIKSLVDFSNAAAISQSPVSGGLNSGANTKSTMLLQFDGQSLQAEDRLEGVGGGNEYRGAIASVLQVVNPDTKSLMDAYSHMNEQILLNERAVEESRGHVQALVGYSPTAAMDFRKQVNELRESIDAEKIKRGATVAALIAHVWKSRCGEFETLLNTQFQSSPGEEQVYHAKWAEIANQILIKEKVISKLERQMEALGESGGTSRSRYANMGKLSSKIAAEYAAKVALESEREGFYVGLVMSNTRVRLLVRDALL